MNYNEIRTLYDNVKQDELVTQTAYEFELFDDYYYQLFHSYSELDKGSNQHDYFTFNSVILCHYLYMFNLYSLYAFSVLITLNYT